MINNFLFNYLLIDTYFETQVYFGILFIIFLTFIQDFYSENNSTTYNFYNTLLGIFIIFDFSIFLSLNYNLFFNSVFDYFIDPILYVYTSITDYDPDRKINSVVTFFYSSDKVGLKFFGGTLFLVSIVIFIFVINYIFFAYINIILVLLRKKKFANLTNHKKWYTLDDLWKK